MQDYVEKRDELRLFNTDVFNLENYPKKIIGIRKD